MSNSDNFRRHKDQEYSSQNWHLQFLETIGRNLRHQQRSGQQCDVTVRVDGVFFTCHKAVLCAASPYFTGMFAHDMKESRESVVVLQEMKADVFEKLLDNIYEGKDILTEENVQDILEVASLMQIEMLIHRIEEYFKEKLTTDNFIDIWYLVKKYSCKNLEREIWKFMTTNFSNLVVSGELNLLPFDTIYELINAEDLGVKTEEMICDAALQWLLADVNERKSLAPKLLSAVRLPLCSTDYLMNRLNQREYTNISPEITVQFQDAMTYRLCPAQKHSYTTRQTTQRISSRSDDVMIVIGGTDISEYSGSGMRCYSYHQKEWFTLPPLPKSIGPHYAICTYGDNVYVSGGQYVREAFCVFFSATCTWATLPKMITGRYNHAMVASGSSVYVVGGEGSTQVKEMEEYHVDLGLWETVTELLQPISHASAAVLGSTILVFGCNNTNNTSSESVQTFDTFTRQVSCVNLSLPGIGAHLVTCDSSVYVLAPNGHVTNIADDMTTEHVGSVPDFNPKRFSLVQHRGIFYIVACTKQSMGTRDESSILVVNPSNMAVLEKIEIPPEGALSWLGNGSRLSCAKVTLGKHHLKGKSKVLKQTTS